MIKHYQYEGKLPARLDSDCVMMTGDDDMMVVNEIVRFRLARSRGLEDMTLEDMT